MTRQQVMVRLKSAQALQVEKLGECLWPTEELDIGEISGRLLLEHLLWAESELNMAESVRA